MSSAPFDIARPATESEISELLSAVGGYDADTVRRLAFERDRLREVNKSLYSLACYAATAECSNTREWLDGLVGHLNASCAVIGDKDRFRVHSLSSIHACRDRTWIEKG